MKESHIRLPKGHPLRCNLPRIEVVALALISFHLVQPQEVRADLHITTDAVQDGGALVVDPAGNLIVSGPTNPRLSLIGGATTSGVTGVGVGYEALESGQLFIGDGSIVTRAGWLYLGVSELSHGSVTVNGDGSQWANGWIFVGMQGSGELTIEDGGEVTSYESYLGFYPDSFGTVTVTGENSTWSSIALLFIGKGGTGSFNVLDGGTVNAHRSTWVNSRSDEPATITVAGIGSSWNQWGSLELGQIGAAELVIADGGTVSSQHTSVAVGEHSQGTVTVTGTGSHWSHFGGWLTVGDRGTGEMSIKKGGTVTSMYASIGGQSGSYGSVAVSGPGSTWANESLFTVAFAGTAEMTIEDGGTVLTNGRSNIGVDGESRGTVNVIGNGSTWNHESELNVGDRGYGELTIEDEGQVVLGGRLILARTDTASGIVDLSGGTLDLGGNDIQFGEGNAAFHFTDGVLANVGTYGGTLHQQGGTLRMGASPGKMTVGGDYLLSSDGEIEIEISGTSLTDYDRLIVAGDATLGGTLAVTLLDDFQPKVGDVFEFLTAKRIEGTFADVALPRLDSGLTWRIGYARTSVKLIVAIPEPSSAALAGLAFVVAGVWRRRAIDLRPDGVLIVCEFGV